MPAYLATLVLLTAVPLAAADSCPVVVTTTGGSVGLWVDGVTTTYHPQNLAVDRSDQINNVVTWDPPAPTDERTLLGYWVYRLPSASQLDPVASFYVDGPEADSFRDTTADFHHAYAYFATAVYEEATTHVSTQSIPSNITPVQDLQGNYPHCEAVQTAPTSPFVFVNVFCLVP